MSSADLPHRARRLIEEVLNQGDLVVASELMSPTCVHHVPGGELVPGLTSLRDWVSRIHRIFPDFHAIVEDQFTAGDQVAQRITAYGTHAATGRTAAFTCLHVVRAGPGGTFTEHWCAADLLAALGQLSAPALRQVI